MSVRMATALVIVFGTAGAAAAVPLEGMVELVLKGKKIEGTPLDWNRQKVRLLGRDGWLWEFAPGEAKEFHKSAGQFRCYSPSEFRATLLRELGQEYEVSGTGHYLVAHPRGERDQWAERFEDLYRSFVHYFSVRGFHPAAPPFPLVGIVCQNRADFARYAANQGVRTPNGVLGYYCSQSNRIILYDTGNKPRRGQPWQETASVILHEATHQTAFNTGIHNRYAPPPHWLAEGLALVFEAPGVHSPREYTEPGHRINRVRLKDFNQGVRAKHRPELLCSIVASDGLFASSPGVAYAEAWALSFFLLETEPRKYTKYLALTAARRPFTEYTEAQRTADFVSIFGSDWKMLEARMLRFTSELKLSAPE